MPFRYIPVELPHGTKTAAFRFLHIEKRNDVGLFYLGKSGLSLTFNDVNKYERSSLIILDGNKPATLSYLIDKAFFADSSYFAGNGGSATRLACLGMLPVWEKCI